MDKESKLEKDSWLECPNCSEIGYRKEVERLLHVCPSCSYHYPISVDLRLRLTVDEDSFREHYEDITSLDPLDFKDEKRYLDRIKAATKKGVYSEAAVCGIARLMGRTVLLCIQDFSFLGGSLGSAMGERLARTAEYALMTRLPLIVFTASGGARMQEGLYSLMQMAKITAPLARLKEEGIPYISVLTDPTTGGVAASYAMQGDVIIAEPKARIGFAGPRVIEKTIGEKLPPGFQRAEYLLEHGLIDAIVERKDMRETLHRLIGLLYDPIPETEETAP